MSERGKALWLLGGLTIGTIAVLLLADPVRQPPIACDGGLGGRVCLVGPTRRP